MLLRLDTATPHAHYFLGLAYLSLNEWKPTPEAQVGDSKEVQYHPQDYLANYMLGFLASSRTPICRSGQVSEDRGRDEFRVARSHFSTWG